MANQRELVTNLGDEGFRKGACHGAQWFYETGKTLEAQGRPAAEIVDHLADLAKILHDWRAHGSDLPDGNPWDWSFKDLASVIKSLKKD